MKYIFFIQTVNNAQRIYFYNDIKLLPQEQNHIHISIVDTMSVTN